MNAVNLIPAGRRPSGRGQRPGAPFLALAAGLVLVLVAGVLYAMGASTVKSRQTRLDDTTAAVARWKVAASSYEKDVLAAQHRTAALGQVTTIAAGRYNWSRLLDQIAGLLPAGSQLTTMQATEPSTASGASTGASSTSSSTGANPGIQITACAANQSTVAETMVRLRRITGISGVTLSSSTDSSSGGSSSSSGSSGSSSGDACAYPVLFQISLTFSAPPAASLSAGTSTSSPTTTSGSSEVSQ